MIRVERTGNLKTTQYLRGRLVNNVTRFYTSQAWVESRALRSSVTAWNQLPSAAYTCVNTEIFGWSHCDLCPALQPQERQPPAPWLTCIVVKVIIRFCPALAGNFRAAVRSWALQGLLCDFLLWPEMMWLWRTSDRCILRQSQEGKGRAKKETKLPSWGGSWNLALGQSVSKPDYGTWELSILLWIVHYTWGERGWRSHDWGCIDEPLTKTDPLVCLLQDPEVQVESYWTGWARDQLA